MTENSRLERRKQVSFAVGLASINGGKPSLFTEKLLSQYEKGDISSNEFRNAIIEKYVRIYR